jgi:predicted TIM-barrel fold metal-dependent hydrolase
MQPSEYFYRNFFVACRGDERTLKSVVELCGDNNFLWNTDYPHPDGTWPTALRKLYDQPIPAESKRKILWDNPARAFHLN